MYPCESEYTVRRNNLYPHKFEFGKPEIHSRTLHESQERGIEIEWRTEDFEVGKRKNVSLENHLPNVTTIDP